MVSSVDLLFFFGKREGEGEMTDTIRVAKSNGTDESKSREERRSLLFPPFK